MFDVEDIIQKDIMRGEATQQMNNLDNLISRWRKFWDNKKKKN